MNAPLILPRLLPTVLLVAHLTLSTGPGCGYRRTTATAPPGAPSATPVTAETPTTPAPPLAASRPSAQLGQGVPLFNGESLDGWVVTDFAGHGEVSVENKELRIGMGAMLTGVTWTKTVPQWDYEVSLEARRLDGSDFFCALTAPVGDSHCSFIVGGWGGGVVGISSLDGQDASENETTTYRAFEKNRWYQIRLRVTREKLEAWIDQDQLVNVSLAGRRISLRVGEIDLSRPLGIATWQTSAALRNIRLTTLTPGS